MDFDLSKLKEPFAEKDIEWRLQQLFDGHKGKCLAYVTNRAIMNRLDEVVGPQNWRNEYMKAPDGGVMCGISIKCNDEWITKWDGAENTNFEAVKGGLSGAMKRAAVQWGIGRYLYDLDEGWISEDKNGKYSAKDKSNVWFKWNPPKIPEWALPVTPGKIKEAKLNLEQFIKNGAFDNSPKLKLEAEAILDTDDYRRICDCISYCKKVSA